MRSMGSELDKNIVHECVQFICAAEEITTAGGECNNSVWFKNIVLVLFEHLELLKMFQPHPPSSDFKKSKLIRRFASSPCSFRHAA